ncbi:MAG: hypothetical protein Q9228_000571 [Teloschistes exilis]
MIWIWQQSYVVVLLYLVNTLVALQLPESPDLLQQPSATRANTTACNTGGSASCNNAQECHVPGTTTTLMLTETFNTISAYSMQTLLDAAQAQVQERLQAGNQPITPFPWNFKIRGLVLVAGFQGWDWKLLNNAIQGLRYCMFRKGIFEEVYVRSVVDPRALDPDAVRYLFLLKHTPTNSDITFPNNVVHRCYIPETHTRLLYDLERDIGAYNMQQILGLVSKELDSKITTQGGNQRVATPWVVQTNGLVLNATFEGWSWQVLKNTLRAIRICLFQKGFFREINVVDTTDPVALPGQRYLRLTRGESGSADTQ